MGYPEDSRKIKALADENRLTIMRILQTGERCACVLLEEQYPFKKIGVKTLTYRNT